MVAHTLYYCSPVRLLNIVSSLTILDNGRFTEITVAMAKINIQVAWLIMLIAIIIAIVKLYTCYKKLVVSL